MCRWLAYSGPPTDLDRLLFEPLDEAGEDWTEAPDRHMLVARAGAVTLAPFAPAAATH